MSAVDMQSLKEKLGEGCYELLKDLIKEERSDQSWRGELHCGYTFKPFPEYVEKCETLEKLGYLQKIGSKSYFLTPQALSLTNDENYFPFISLS